MMQKAKPTRAEIARAWLAARSIDPLAVLEVTKTGIRIMPYIAPAPQSDDVEAWFDKS